MRRGWLHLLLICGGCCLLICSPLPSHAQQSQAEPAATTSDKKPTYIAAFRPDFQPKQPGRGWRYYWNRKGAVGHTNAYVDLIWNGTVYATSERALPAPSPARYLRLSGMGGHPGQGPSQTASVGIDYENAVIIAFTVPTAGSFAIANSFIARHAGARGGSVHLQVWLNERIVGAEVYCSSADGIPFDRELGNLAAGDVIYVSVGAGETDLDDAFELDFAIARF